MTDAEVIEPEDGWRLAHRILASEIRSNLYAEGDCLPPQSELVARFGIQRHQLRRALQALKQEGLIEGGQGARPRVLGERIELPVSLRTRFTESVEGMGLPPTARLVSSRRRRMPTPRIARLLGLSRLATVPVAIILRSVGERPISLSSHHFSPKFVSSLPFIPVANPSVTQILRALGIPDYIRYRSLIGARLPTESEATHLQIRRSEPELTAIGERGNAGGFRVGVSCQQSRPARQLLDARHDIDSGRSLDHQAIIDRLSEFGALPPTAPAASGPG